MPQLQYSSCSDWQPIAAEGHRPPDLIAALRTRTLPRALNDALESYNVNFLLRFHIFYYYFSIQTVKLFAMNSLIRMSYTRICL